jgi:hypothetical protein
MEALLEVHTLSAELREMEKEVPLYPGLQDHE